MDAVKAVARRQQNIPFQLDWPGTTTENSPVGMMLVDNNVLKSIEHYLSRLNDDMRGSSPLANHEEPRTVRKILCDPRNLSYKLQLQVGARIMEIPVSPVYDDRRNLIGHVVVWQAMKTLDHENSGSA